VSGSSSKSPIFPIMTKKYNRLNRRFGYLRSDTLPSPKRPIHTAALCLIKNDFAENILIVIFAFS
ncbi:MAG: hypothetical protein ACI9GZ_003891, partial [Bacteroidia bacterium]